jgi:hypothetical protein
VGLIGHEVVPAPRREQGSEVRHLDGAAAVELILPAGDESPGVRVAEDLASGAAQQRPVLLGAEAAGRAAELGDGLALVTGFGHEDGHRGRRVVALEHDLMSGLIRVGRVDVDDGQPARVVRGEHRIEVGTGVEQHRVQMTVVELLDAQRDGRHQRVVRL